MPLTNYNQFSTTNRQITLCLRLGLARHRQLDVSGPRLQLHGLAQHEHGLLIRLAEQRAAVDVEELVVGAQLAALARRAPIDHRLDEDAQVDGAVALLQPLRLALDRDAQARRARVVQRDLEREQLPLAAAGHLRRAVAQLLTARARRSCAHRWTRSCKYGLIR